MLICNFHEDIAYELIFSDCNINKIELSDSSILCPMRDLISHKLSNGGYKIQISFSSKNGGSIELSCSDFNVCQIQKSTR